MEKTTVIIPLFLIFDANSAINHPRIHETDTAKKGSISTFIREINSTDISNGAHTQYTIREGKRTIASYSKAVTYKPAILTKRISPDGIGIESRRSLSFAS